MSKFVFVLGAGASADSGAPTTDNFMDKAERFLADSSLGGRDRDAFELVFKARNELKAVQSKATLPLDNLEVLFGAFEMAALFDRLGSLSSDEVSNLRGAMCRVIARTIEKSQNFPVQMTAIEPFGDEMPTLRAPLSYQLFAKLLEQLCGDRPSDVSVLTFNYDLALDLAVCVDGIPVDYALDENVKDGVQFLKLHGSLNWRLCKCGRVVSWQFKDLIDDEFWKGLVGKNSYCLEGSLYQPQRQHCAAGHDSDPLIVPPTWNKGQHHSQLSSVWRKAAQQFSDAEYVFIMGYSYPRSDEFFRYLYALGSVGDAWLKKVFVFNPDREVDQRIRGLLGPQAANRFVFDPINFDQAIRFLAEWHQNLGT